MNKAVARPARFRMHAAALALLAPLGAALLAQPAAAQHRAVVAQAAPAPAIAPAIERFVLRTHGKPQAGHELRFRLVGRPGGEAWVDVPGVIHGMDLAETRPGVYEATYTVRRRDDASAFARAAGTLQNGNQRATARVDVRGDEVGEGRRRDEIAPVIADVTPAEGERVDGERRTRITARLTDEGSGVDTGSVRLRVDGRDVTPDVRVEGEELRFRGFLGRGRHTADLVVKDRAGNVTRKSWTFAVAGRG